MQKQLVAILIIALIALAGCQQKPVGPEPQGPAETAGKALQPDLEHYEMLESMEYETITGTIDPGKGGVLSGTLKTWGGDYAYGVVVPAGALDSAGPSVEFSISVPTYQSYMEFAHRNPPLILRLEPDGAQFHKPVTVLAPWLPWADRLPEQFWCVVPTYRDSKVVGVTYEDVGEVDLEPAPTGWRVSFDVNHFSEWETGAVGD